ncbi:MAG: tetratricopeptide repeat protein [Deltaproteobacteria bacterium]|nr:tetratricopeptide repeat protein [Deltaproteobacteria bacterium]
MQSGLWSSSITSVLFLGDGCDKSPNRPQPKSVIENKKVHRNLLQMSRTLPKPRTAGEHLGWFKKLLGKKDRKGAEKEVAKGAIAARRARFDTALGHYEKAVRIDDSYPLAHLNLALAQQDRFNRDRDSLPADEKRERLLVIIDLLETTLSLDPHNVFAWHSLGVAAMSLKAPIRAEEAFARVLEICDEEFPHFDDVKRYFERMTKAADRERQVQRVLQLSRNDDDKNDEDEIGDEEILQSIAEVQDVLDASADEEPRNDLFFAAAVLYKKLEDKENARLFFERVLETLPYHPRALREAATLCLLLGDVDDALQHSLAAYREDPTDPGVTCNVGVCYLTSGELDKAGEYIQLAKDLDPKDAIVAKAQATWQQVWNEVNQPAS